MTDVLLVLCTCSSQAEASQMAHALVSEGVAACVNMVPAVESVYRWQGKIETSQEILLMIKTTRERFKELQDLIVKLHSYETPEVIAVDVMDGLEKYLVWLKGEVK
jgi:periplasmic divalent cation tolerance protein